MADSPQAPALVALPPVARVLAVCAGDPAAPDAGARLRAALAEVEGWGALTAAAARLGMMGLLHRRAGELCPGAVPAEVSAEWRRQAVGIARWSLRMQRRLVAVASCFEAAGVPFLAFKGPALAEQVYGDAALRTFCDLDLLVAEACVGDAREALLALGYRDVRPFGAVGLDRLLHAMQEVVLREPVSRTVVELHWREGPRFAHASLAAEDVLRRADAVELLGRRVPAPGPSDTVLLVAVHAATHDWGRFEDVAALSAGLRRLGADQQTELQERAGELRCSRRLHVGVLLAVGFGAAAPGRALWDAALRDRPARRLAAAFHARLVADAERAGRRPPATPGSRAAEIVREALGMETRAAGAEYFWRRLITPGVNDWHASADDTAAAGGGGPAAAAAAVATQLRRQKRLWRHGRRPARRDLRP